jgi:hypothetical protein
MRNHSWIPYFLKVLFVSQRRKVATGGPIDLEMLEIRQQQDLDEMVEAM